jgi:hypothetical protein
MMWFKRKPNLQYEILQELRKMAQTMADLNTAIAAVSGKLDAVASDLTAFINAEGTLVDFGPAIASVNALGTKADALDAQIKAATPVPTS